MERNQQVYVALLRGINVGGNSLIKMSELKTCFEDAGFNNVSTYINSGNIFFTSEKLDLRSLERVIEDAIAAQFSLDVKTVIRTKPQISDVIRSIPSNWKVNPEQKCNVIFLRHEIDRPHILQDLSPKPDIEEVAYIPGALLWAASTSDLTKSSMIKLSTKPMYKLMTVRNLNTTYKIHEIMNGHSYSDCL